MHECVVFTHFHFNPDKQSVFRSSDVARIHDTWKERLQRYQDCPSIERLFVFISVGYQALLDVRKLSAPFIGLETDRRLIRIVRKAARDAGCAPGFVVPVGFDRMVDVLARLQRRAEEYDQVIGYLLLGSGKHMRYDSPKIVDAILRIAGRETDSPVFRIDDDVTPNEEGLKRLIDCYRTMPERGTAAVFVFSGGYGGWNYNNPNEQQNALRNNYAVRTFHLARLGTLESDACEAFLDGLGGIGAEQGFSRDREGGNRARAQVISGAGFCLSYAAVKKLPPFANLDYPITWIDDHLKRRMHEGLHDLGPNWNRSRIVDALFRQNRTDHAVTGSGVLGYLTTLARGCIFDALIRTPRGAGSYTQAIKEYLHGDSGHPKIFAEDRSMDSTWKARPLTDFGVELARAGSERLEKVVEHWSVELSGEELELDGGVPFVPRRDIGRHLRPADLQGNRVTNAGDCRVYEVLEDAEQYLELLRVWPGFVNLLEAITDGTGWLLDGTGRA
jgi:hypothetical protein